MIGLMCMKELILTKTVVYASALFCHYWYICEINFRFQSNACDDCHDLMQNTMNLHDVGTVLVKKMVMEFIFCIWVKMEPSIYCEILLWLKNGTLQNKKNYHPW